MLAAHRHEAQRPFAQHRLHFHLEEAELLAGLVEGDVHAVAAHHLEMADRARRSSVTSLIDGSITNSETGTDNSSLGPSTRGSVASMLSGWRTATVLAAEPYAPRSPATTITRTAPI